MTTLATLLRPGNQHNEIAAANLPSGSVLVTPECNVAVLQGLKAKLSGEQARFDNQDVYNFSKGSIAFAEGDTVYLDSSNNVAATGFVRIGRCAAAAASGDATVAVRLYKDAQLVKYAAVAASAALTNTTTPTTMSGIPAIPPNTLRVGDTIRIRVQGIATATNSTDTLLAKLQLTPVTSGSAVDLASTGALDVANNDVFYIDFLLQIRTIGATGTMVGAGLAFIGTPGTAAVTPVFKASATIDTTQGQTLGVQGTWGAANAGDSCRLDVCEVEIIRS